jgi:hypothetical protein
MSMNMIGLIGANTVEALEASTLAELLAKPVKDDARWLLDLKILTFAIPDGRQRLVNDEELPEATAALSKLVGREAKLPSWQRHLARYIDKKEWLISLKTPHPTMGGYPTWMPPKTSVVALPIDLGVAILRSPNNPEAAILRAREAFSASEGERERKAAERAERKAAESTEERKLERDRIKYHAAEWTEATVDERFAVLLALASENTPADPAANVRAALAGSKKPGDFPRVEWWKNTGILERLNAPKTAEEEERAQKAAMIECDRIPVRTRDLLWIRHGSDYVAQLKTWRMLQAQQPASTP